MDNERNVAKVKKKAVSPITRTPKSTTPRLSKPIPSSSSTPRVSKPISSSSRTSALQSSAKKASTPSVQKNKNPSTGETKKVVSKSLHMSLTLGATSTSTNSDSPTVTTIRRSLIMEKMGDKDIVKRAFKAFQNNFNQVKSYGEDGSPLQKQVYPFIMFGVSIQKIVLFFQMKRFKLDFFITCLQQSGAGVDKEDRTKGFHFYDSKEREQRVTLEFTVYPYGYIDNCNMTYVLQCYNCLCCDCYAKIGHPKKMLRTKEVPRLLHPLLG